ncbi:MAG: hypothetical protein IVW57_07200, partial [Ktedonobacterales bacterium]|nr:hypothetical protein [Ktedonobacterales bacterium]
PVVAERETGNAGTMPRQRLWPAVLALYFLAPLTAEVLTNSTPILVFLTNPVGFLYQPALYGSGAILVREAARRRGLGWSRIVLLGAAYGILEEGLIVTSWFNPFWPDVCNRATHPPSGLCDYSRIAQTNLIWALSLTAYHAIFSIAIPILLVETIFPRRAALPWLRRRGLIGFSVLLGLVWLSGAALFGFAFSRAQGYTHPPLVPYLAAVALAATLIWLGLRRPRAKALTATEVPSPPGALTPPARKPPRLWGLRVLGFVVMFGYFAVPALLQASKVPFPITLAVIAALLALLAWRIARWSRRPGWNTRHHIALAAGALSFFILVFDPILEVAGQVNGKITRGTSLFALAYLILLIWLSLRARRLEGEVLSGDGLGGAIPRGRRWRG